MSSASLPSSPRTLADVLAVQDDVVLLESLGALLPDDARVAPARHMVEVLSSIQLYLSANGIWQVLDVGLADEWLAVEAWWTALGAHRAAALAAAVASLFPGGRVPDTEEARYDRFTALVENGQHGRPHDDPWRGIGIFTRLDLEFADAVADVARAVRRLLEANADDPAGALARVATSAREFTPPPRPTEWSAYADNGLDGAAEIAAVRARWQAMMQGVPTPPAPRQDDAVDARVLSFLDDIARLTADDWSRIAGRRLALSAERKALELALGRTRLAIPRELGPEATRRLREAGAESEAARAGMITRSLPRIGMVGPHRGPLEHWAIRAALQGLDAVRWYDDLAREEEGRRVLRVMLSPFEGYIGLQAPNP